MKVHWIAAICLVLTPFSSLNAQGDSLARRNNIIIYGGLAMDYSKGADLNSDYKLKAKLNLGLEYFFINRMSIGCDMDYYIDGTGFLVNDNRRIYYGEHSTTIYLDAYSKKLYYLRTALSWYRYPDSNQAYPESALNYFYSIGLGKRVFLSEHITGVVGINLSYMKGFIRDTDGDTSNLKGVHLSLYTGIQIFINPKFKNYEEN